MRAHEQKQGDMMPALAPEAVRPVARRESRGRVAQTQPRFIL